MDSSLPQIDLDDWLRTELTVVILSGGEGRRVGGMDKGLLLYQEKPLFRHAVEKLANRVSEVLLSVNRHLDRYAGTGYRLIADAQLGYRGPLSGISTALQECKTPFLATIPVDVPDWPFACLKELVLSLITQHAEAVVMHDGVRRHPLFAVYRTELAQSALTALTDQRMPVWLWQDHIRAIEVTYVIENGLRDLNERHFFD
jgi:molybdopterin-guanine dinucleotide biosynthesis protein A